MKTSFSLIFTVIIALVFCFPLTAQDHSQIGLPEGVIARLGKGSLGEVHFSPDGSQLAISTAMGIWFHDPQTGKRTGRRKRVIFKGPGAVYTVVFSKDRKRIIATGDWKNKVRVWHATTGKELTPTPADIPRSGSKGLSPSPDGTTTAQVSQDGTVLIRKAKTTLEKK